jgi:hypothetical protein
MNDMRAHSRVRLVRGVPGTCDVFLASLIKIVGRGHEQAIAHFLDVSPMIAQHGGWWLWEVSAYKAAFDTVKRLSPSHYRKGTKLR